MKFKSHGMKNYYAAYKREKLIFCFHINDLQMSISNCLEYSTIKPNNYFYYRFVPVNFLTQASQKIFKTWFTTYNLTGRKHKIIHGFSFDIV